MIIMHGETKVERPHLRVRAETHVFTRPEDHALRESACCAGHRREGDTLIVAGSPEAIELPSASDGALLALFPPPASGAAFTAGYLVSVLEGARKRAPR